MSTKIDKDIERIAKALDAEIIDPKQKMSRKRYYRFMTFDQNSLRILHKAKWTWRKP